MSTPATGRYHALDALRAAMMLLGLVLHSAINYVAEPIPVWPYQDPATSAAFDWLVLTIHVFRMPVFFILAGFFSALLASRSMRALIRNRLERVAFPFAIAWLVLSPIVLLGSWASLQWRYGSAEDRLAELGHDSSSGSLWQDNTFHLWFLYLLLFLNLGGILVTLATRLFPEHWRERVLDGFEALAQSPWRLLPLAALSFLATLPMSQGSIETPISFRPSLATLLAYAPFFAFGWLLFLRREALAAMTKLAGTQLFLGLLLVLIHGVALGLRAEGESESAEGARWLALGSLALSAWLMSFGLIGLGLRWLGEHSRVLRYVSDSSYWLYLIHLPFTIVLPALFARAAWPAWLKFACVLGVTTFIGFLSYHVLVRATLIGRILNGRRYPLRLPFGPEGQPPAAAD